jgi:hypothetical protein
LDDRAKRRAEARAARDMERVSHPFDRTLPLDPVCDVYDDGYPSYDVLLCFPGAADRLGMPSVKVFEAIADFPVRRVYVRHLVAALKQPHQLGGSVAEMTHSIERLLAGRRRTICLGTSLGGFHALLFGTLLRADAVLAVNPITSLRRDVLERGHDERWDDVLSRAAPVWLELFGDLPTLWERYPPPPVVLHYPYRYPAYAVQAEHIAELPNVTVVPHYENSPMDKLYDAGVLPEILHELLWPTGGARVER